MRYYLYKLVFAFASFLNWWDWVALRSGSVLRTLPEGECEAGTPTHPVYRHIMLHRPHMMLHALLYSSVAIVWLKEKTARITFVLAW